MSAFSAFLVRRALRWALTLLPVVFAVLHASGIWHFEPLDRLDHTLYDLRLRATMPRTIDPRIVIVDIDEKSLAQLGHWPWGRNRLAQLADELFVRQQTAVVGFDVLFAEPDVSSGLASLKQLTAAGGALAAIPELVPAVNALDATLDYDRLFADALRGRPAVLGTYFTSDSAGVSRGVLPAPAWREANAIANASGRSEPVSQLPPGAAPALNSAAAPGLTVPAIRTLEFTGAGANLAELVLASASAGFMNPVTDADGVIRAVPLLARYQGAYYPSLALAVLQRLYGDAVLRPIFAPQPAGGAAQAPAGGAGRILQAVQVQHPDGAPPLMLPVDDRAAALVPYRGPGGASGGSFAYLSAADVLAGKLAPEALRGKVVLVGTTAPGLVDLRVTPVGETFPGVEIHANLLSGMLDARLPVQPDYSAGYDVTVLVVAGLILAFALPQLGMLAGAMLAATVMASVIALNLLLYLRAGLVLPLAGQLMAVLLAFLLNMAYGYFVENRGRRHLARLFSSYVPRELVAQMLRAPGNYSMRAESRELTVMFCDMRGFTTLSETMEPVALQALLNRVFTRLTSVIRQHQGTIDKYMGDCVMAFWGAPVAMPDHAARAVAAARDMVAAMGQLNQEHAVLGLPAIGIGIGINTGVMCVGDMGSQSRRSYTVIGDAVNVGARLEALCKRYGVTIIVSDETVRCATPLAAAQAAAASANPAAGEALAATTGAASDASWLELDLAAVRGRTRPIRVFTPLQPGDVDLPAWQAMLAASRAGRWAEASAWLSRCHLAPTLQRLQALHQKKIAEAAPPASAAPSAAAEAGGSVEPIAFASAAPPAIAHQAASAAAQQAAPGAAR